MKKISKSCVAFLCLTGFVLPAAKAQAGFEWVAPSNSGGAMISSSSYAPAPAPVPLAGSPDVISPVVISGDAHAPQSLTPPMPPPAPVSSAPQMRSYNATQPLSSATIDMNAPMQISASPSAGGDVVQGFASQVPLTLALRQVLPPNYNFSIDQDVSMDTPVSYSGGRPWRDTMTTMLASVGLVGHEQGNVFSVSHGRVGAAASAGPVLVPAPEPASNPAFTTAPIVSSDDDTITMQDRPVMYSSFPPPAPRVVSVSSAPASSPSSSYTMSSASGSDEWSAERGETLRKVLTDWCRHANIELQWMTEYDYPIEGSAHFSAGFEDAVRGLLAGFDTARPQPIGELHDSTVAGQKVLVVQARGNNYTN